MNLQNLACLMMIISLCGCSLIRTVDDTVSSFLEPIPGMKFLGIESRQSIEKAAKANEPVKTEIVPVVIPPVPVVPALPQKVDVTLELKSDTWLNPNAQNNSSPVQIRIFQLEKINKFKQSTAFALLINPTQTLGSDLTSTEDVSLAPGEHKSLVMTTNRISFIAILANYRTTQDPKDQNRVILIPNNSAIQTKKIRLAGTHIEISDDGDSHAQHTNK
jgi:type VI secretion system VasD/TssJ family lipoprotein